jgi:hypothetical protein
MKVYTAIGSLNRHLEPKTMTNGVVFCFSTVLGDIVIDFKPHLHKESWDDILLPLYFNDGASDIKQTLADGNEPMLPSANRLVSDPIVRELSTHEIWKVCKQQIFALYTPCRLCVSRAVWYLPDKCHC